MTREFDVVVVGGGVMGLFTAYDASAAGARVAVLERGTIGDPRTASFGRTRSYRRDYLDPLYVRLAEAAIGLWDRFEQATGVRALVRCGCMNVASSAVTPDLDATYGAMSAQVMARLGAAPQTLDRAAIAGRFGYLDADVAHLDPAGGLVDLRAVTAALTATLAARGVAVHEHTAPVAIQERDGVVVVRTPGDSFTTRSVVITAGHGTNEVLDVVAACELTVPITKDRPSEARYYDPPADVRSSFTADAMPVIAYLDTGVYVHPIVPGVVEHVKIGYYHPPDIPRERTGVRDIAEFVRRCMPGLVDASSVELAAVDDVDQCDYDLVADDDFVLGAVPSTSAVYVGVGWRGTGYKFGPWVGATLAGLALGGAPDPDIARFDPSRFSLSEVTA